MEERVFFKDNRGGKESRDSLKTLAEVLKSQYISTEFDDIVAASEIREHEVIPLTGVMMNRDIMTVLAAKEETVSDLDTDKRLKAKERLEKKERILNDPNAMSAAILDSYLYSFVTLRKSLDRQSRTEAKDIVTAQLAVGKSGEDMGMLGRSAAKLGIGDNKVVYVEK